MSTKDFVWQISTTTLELGLVETLGTLNCLLFLINDFHIRFLFSLFVFNLCMELRPINN